MSGWPASVVVPLFKPSVYKLGKCLKNCWRACINAGSSLPADNVRQSTPKHWNIDKYAPEPYQEPFSELHFNHSLSLGNDDQALETSATLWFVYHCSSTMTFLCLDDGQMLPNALLSASWFRVLNTSMTFDIEKSMLSHCASAREHCFYKHRVYLVIYAIWSSRQLHMPGALHQYDLSVLWKQMFLASDEESVVHRNMKYSGVLH